MARKPKPEKEGSRQSYATAWDHFKQAATHAGRGAARDTADAYAYAKPRVKAAAQKASESVRNWYDSLSHDERYNAWRKHGIFPTSRASIKKVAGLNGIDATDDAQILYELECKAYGAPRVGSMSGEMSGAYAERGEAYEIPTYDLPKIPTKKGLMKELKKRGWTHKRNGSHFVFVKGDDKVGIQTLPVPDEYDKNMRAVIKRELNAKEATIA